jgi:trans-2-enoyl-CoA reductase
MASGVRKSRKLFSLPRVSRRAQVALDDHLRLKADYEQLRKDFTALQKQVEEHHKELRLQFVRIAQIQAVLDEERKDDYAKVQAKLS